MSSFTRADYQAIFHSAVKIWLHTEQGSLPEAEAVKIMDLCERILGQQMRPDRIPETTDYLE